MGLPIPIVSQDPGPTYATNVNTCLTTIDSHDHSTDKGVPITPSGMNITADLPFGGNNVTQARSVRFSSQPAPISGISDIGCVYESGVDLYYNDGDGNQVRLTQSGGVAGTPGSITGLVSPAAVTYVAPTFVFQSGSNIAGNLDARNVILRNSAASSYGLTLQPPAGMVGDFNVVLPALPGSQSFMTIDASGNMAAPVVYPLTAAGIATGTINTSSFNSSVYATQAQQEATTDTRVIVTPGRQHYHPSAAKAWCKTDYGGLALASYGVNAIQDNGGGDLTVLLTTVFSSVNFAAVATGMWFGAGINTTGVAQVVDQTTNSVRVINLVLSSGARGDGLNMHVVCFGDF